MKLSKSAVGSFTCCLVLVLWPPRPPMRTGWEFSLTPYFWAIRAWTERLASVPARMEK